MRGYAVIDTETTGLNLRGKDRIIEIAVVLVDMDLNILSRHETVLNPSRDLGLTSLHGIDGLTASHGTTFDAIIPSLSFLLHDRIIVAHNTNFDIKMLTTEYDKVGVFFDFGTPIDTLQLAKKSRLYVSNYKLETLCDNFDIPLTNAHTAGDDTMATAMLFIELMKQNQNRINAAPAYFDVNFSMDFSSWIDRSQIQQELFKRSDLKSHFLTLSTEDKELPEKSISTYLSTLHRALINGRYSPWERTQMEELITNLSLTQQHVLDLNEEYVFMLICQHLAKNQQTWKGFDFHIETVMSFVGVTENRAQQLLDETLLNKHLILPTYETLQGYFNIVVGDGFVLTGEDFEYSKEHWEIALTDKGLILKNGPTKKGTKFVVAGDPYSLSAKAVKAREYGIPVLSEETLIRKIQ